MAFTKHVKRRSGGQIVDGLESQITSELKQRYGHDVMRVDILGMVGRYKSLDFSWPRVHGRRTGQVFGARVEFKHEVAGPLALGYASHYGMGLFEPEAVHV